MWSSGQWVIWCFDNYITQRTTNIRHLTSSAVCPTFSQLHRPPLQRAAFYFKSRPNLAAACSSCVRMPRGPAAGRPVRPLQEWQRCHERNRQRSDNRGKFRIPAIEDEESLRRQKSQAFLRKTRCSRDTACAEMAGGVGKESRRLRKR